MTWTTRAGEPLAIGDFVRSHNGWHGIIVAGTRVQFPYIHVLDAWWDDRPVVGTMAAPRNLYHVMVPDKLAAAVMRYKLIGVYACD